MKKSFRIFVLILILLVGSSIEAFAIRNSDNTNEIKIDGKFNDWKGKPNINDYKNDIESNWLNFKEVKYYADDRYLYLYVERQSAKKSETWDFEVLILNATIGKIYSEEIPVKYYKKYNYYRPYEFEEMDYAIFKISNDYTYKKSSKGIPVSVSFNGEIIETTLSASNNNKKIEFRIPLDKVGLNGPNKEVKFMLKSAFDENADKKGEYPYDWIPNGKPILITTGPTYWQISSAILFIMISFIAYRVYKKTKRVYK